MALATHAFTTLPLPRGIHVPAGALNHTGVQRVMTVAAARARGVSVEPMRASCASVRWSHPSTAAGVGRLLTYPPSLARWLAAGLTYLPPWRDAALT